jgi:hypothetical protein
MYLDLSLKGHCAGGFPADLILTPDASTVGTRVVLQRQADDEDDIIINIVTSDRQRSDVSALINRMYAWRGYGSHHDLSALATQTTFAVSTGGSTIGTLTLTVDSEMGLSTDATFRDELNTYRRVPGAKICELTRFAFDAENPSKRLLASLFHVIFIYGQRKYGCTDLFIEVAQRHRRFYETMLGFERVCPLKTNDSVGVPSQLMRLNVADIQSYIDAHRGSPQNAACRSLYPFFLAEREESRIYSELNPVLCADLAGLRPSRGGDTDNRHLEPLARSAAHNEAPTARA